MPPGKSAVAPDQPSSLAAEAREALGAFLSPRNEEAILGALNAWNTPPPLGHFEVEGGLLLPPEFRVSDFVVDLGEVSTARPESMRAVPASHWQALFTLRDSADADGFVFPYRAHLVQRPAGWAPSAEDLVGAAARYGPVLRWFLTRIESQCTSCFGAGVVEADLRPCDTCGGEGWGLISSELHRI